ncbi:MAG: hypothetical protein V5804_15545 [Mucilaginibacter sp.]|uniref:hypothetical protein n=1 Tax=Mucilaginibacter sp. TaxID=1882438 RepID=UPI0034E38C09
MQELFWMSYKIRITPYFERSLKKIAKKHRSIKSDVSILIEKLEQEPKTGIEIRTDLYKIRLSIAGLNKGKSGGARVITYVFVTDEIVLLAEIYLKSEYDTIDEQAVIEGLKEQGYIL